MKRVKELISEADVVKRNPLLPVTSTGRMYDDRDIVVVDDLSDDTATLHGKINARGRADVLRSQEVDAARRLQNKSNIYNQYAPILKELMKKLNDEDEWRMANKVERLLSELEDIVPFQADIDYAKKKVRRPIHIGSQFGGGDTYVGHKAIWDK